MPPSLEITNVRCAAVHYSSVTKTSSVKPVTDEPASCLTGNGTNLLHFKTHQVPLTHPLDDT